MPTRPVTERDLSLGPMIAVLIVIWCIAGLLLAFHFTGLQDPFLPVAEFLRLVWGVTWLFLLATCFWVGRRARQRAAALLLACLMTLAAAVFVVVWQPLVTLGDETRLRWEFERLRGRYEAIVAELGHRPTLAEGQQWASGIRYVVEPGPPLRVAFPWPGGIVDNWCGVVFDPSGLVLKARQFKPDLSNFDDPALREVRRLFGGDLRSCKPLGGDWYFCCFT